MAVAENTATATLFLADAADVPTTQRTAAVLASGGFVQTSYNHHGRLLTLTATYATDTVINEDGRMELLTAWCMSLLSALADYVHVTVA